ncbi:L-lactate MFS transporter [Methanoculleus sp. 7T]|uniref:L-lactate MFS transporter n=1 Tax=Methanoculleus sp. 7T TaxID=2937282 RepID=UPI0020BEC97E|nr:OFA family MFS transporter [Methanoculleus sp. 7T]MCK8518498.1 OFA family MFS transporter [Methanoculleus sp. 7T]
MPNAPKVLGMPAERGRWGLVALGLLINLCLGSIYSWSVFVTPLAAHFTATLGREVTAGEVLLPFSVFLAFFAVAMPLSGKYIERYGPRAMTIVGGLLTGLGWLLASTATSIQMLYIVYGVIGGLGVGIAYGAPVAVAARWFPDRRGLAVGLTLLGFGFSAFFTANAAGALIAAYGVMATFGIFGAVFIVVLALSALPLRFPPEGWRPEGWRPPAPGTGTVPACECDRKAMLRTGTFYGLFACYFIGCLAGLAAISIAKPVGTEVAGVDAGLATLLVGLFAVFNGLGRPVFGSLADRITPRTTAMLTFALIAAASVLIWLVPGVPAYILSFAVLWGCLGGWLAIAPTATAAYFGTCDYPRCYGVVFLAYGAGAIAGPQLAGFVRTATGTYLGVFPAVAALAVVGFAVAWLLLRPVRTDEDRRLTPSR